MVEGGVRTTVEVIDAGLPWETEYVRMLQSSENRAHVRLDRPVDSLLETELGCYTEHIEEGANIRLGNDRYCQVRFEE